MHSSLFPQSSSSTPPSYQPIPTNEHENDGREGLFAVNRTAKREPLPPPFESPGPSCTCQDGPSRRLLGSKAALILAALALFIGPLLGSMVGSAMTNTLSGERTPWDAERQAWEDVRLAERKEALEERRRAREKLEEEEERRKAGIHWLGLERAPHCTRYGTREYRAKLGPVGGGYDSLNACRETGVEIHGRLVKPNSCDDMGAYNGMWGVWAVDFEEAACRTYWGDFKDQGCSAPGSGLRHIEANLKNHDASDDWNTMCASTPYDFNGLHFDGAMSCANWGKRGIYGFWDIEDKRCE